MLRRCACSGCGDAFIAKRSDAKFCLNCRKKRIADTQRKSKQKNKDKIRETQRKYNQTNRVRPSRKITHEVIKCIHCGKEFVPTRSDQYSCGLRDKQHRGSESPNKKVVECKRCGSRFETDVSYYNFSIRTRGYITCSVACAMLLKGKTKEFHCDHCGKLSRMPASQFNQSKYHFCGSECRKSNLDYVNRGKNSYLFKDGKTCLKRGIGWTKIRREVRERDGFACRVCGKTEEELGKKLDVHHIKPYREFKTSQEANVYENLISLCSSCHHKIEVRTHVKSQRNECLD